MTTVSPHGLHHVTAIATDPQANVDFYTRALGLRLVKQTVNFDAPDTYHLYYGDEQGSPSSLLTFFPWPGVPQGRQGAGMTTATAFSVPETSLGWWHERFTAWGSTSTRRRPGTRRRCSPSATRTAWCSTWWPPWVTTAPAGTASPTSRPSTPYAACTPSPCPSGSSTRPPAC